MLNSYKNSNSDFDDESMQGLVNEHINIFADNVDLLNENKENE
jgi:hypothetical protein